MTSIKDVFFTEDGANLEYTIEGSGERLLFLDDCEHEKEHMEQLRRWLASQFQVYNLDRRGWGNSAWRPEKWTVSQDCEDVRAFMVAMDIQRIFAVGYGTLIALCLAGHKNSRFHAVLLDPYLRQERSFRWLRRMDRELYRADVFNAAVTYVKSLYDQEKWTPRSYVRFRIPGFIFGLKEDRAWLYRDAKTPLLHRLASMREERKVLKLVKVSYPRGETAYLQDALPSSWDWLCQKLAVLRQEARAAKKMKLPDLSGSAVRFQVLWAKEGHPATVRSARRLLALLPDAAGVELPAGLGQEELDGLIGRFLKED